MKNKILLTFAFAVFGLTAAKAQIFIMEEDQTSRKGTFSIPVPGQGSGNDQFMPLGSGALLLVGFGAAYALLRGKKRKEE